MDSCRPAGCLSDTSHPHTCAMHAKENPEFTEDWLLPWTADWLLQWQLHGATHGVSLGPGTKPVSFCKLLSFTCTVTPEALSLSISLSSFCTLRNSAHTRSGLKRAVSRSTLAGSSRKLVACTCRCRTSRTPRPYAAPWTKLCVQKPRCSAAHCRGKQRAVRSSTRTSACPILTCQVCFALGCGQFSLACMFCRHVENTTCPQHPMGSDACSNVVAHRNAGKTRLPSNNCRV